VNGDRHGDEQCADIDTARLIKRDRVLIADDHPLFRLSLREELEAEGLEVCAEAASANEAIIFASELRPELCLLDINMSGSGIEAARTILASVPDTKIVLLTASSEFDDFVAAVDAGAAGYLVKHMDPTQFGQALRDVLAGRTAYPRSLAARLFDPSGR
jgi:DNA-binding NarL/FixJ family response regulator